MSEGRQLVVAYNDGFHWGLSPGIVVVHGDVGFALGVAFGYGFDTGTVLVVPGVQLSCILHGSDGAGRTAQRPLRPAIDRFAPFVVGGAGVGNVGKHDNVASTTGAALLAGGGFMVHVSSRFAIGAEVNYQTITGTDFSAIGVVPILAIGF